MATHIDDLINPDTQHRSAGHDEGQPEVEEEEGFEHPEEIDPAWLTTMGHRNYRVLSRRPLQRKSKFGGPRT